MYNISPTFENAQKLFKSYNTIESINILKQVLNNIINKKYLENFRNMNVKEIYNQILLDYYPNETAIKSQFVNKKLMRGKTHVTIFELPIINSRIDLCKINGKSAAYEIKTDLDNFNRLEKQLNDYYKIFDEVFVICSTNRITEIQKLIPKKTGIISYRITNNKKYIFKTERYSQKNLDIDNREQLNSLSNNDLFSLITNKRKKISRDDYIELIMDTKSHEQINKLFKECLKNKYSRQWNFLKMNQDLILEIDYQWFFKNTINPNIIYCKPV